MEGSVGYFNYNKHMTQILDGKLVSQTIKDQLKVKVAELDRKPGLAVVLVGNDPASQVYVRNKEKACAEIGYYSRKIELPETVTEIELINTVIQLNKDSKVHGILVQFPLPQNLRHLEEKVINTILPAKDVDCFHPINVGKLVTAKNLDDNLLMPCTPYGVIRILEHYQIPISGKHVVILGRSNIVGKPEALMMLAKDATVTICHSKTQNLTEITKQTDIIVAAIGKPEFLTSDMVKEGAVVIDVGINRTDNGLVGDVKFDELAQKTSAITPVPGGVGPMTIAILMENVWKAYNYNN